MYSLPEAEPYLENGILYILKGLNEVKNSHWRLPANPTNGDWFRVRNLNEGPLVIAAAELINGKQKTYYVRGPETVNVRYDSTDKWFITRDKTEVQSVSSPSGVLADALRLFTDSYNHDEALQVYGCTNADENGMYIRQWGGSDDWIKVPGEVPRVTSQIVGTTTLNLTSGFANVQLTATDLDGSGSDYTITLASDRIEFDNTDGTKSYKVTYSMDVTSGTILKPIELRAELDNVLVSRSGASIELAANQEATITKSFIVTPPTSASNNNYLDFLARQNDALPDGAVVEILVLVERVA